MAKNKSDVSEVNETDEVMNEAIADLVFRVQYKDLVEFAGKFTVKPVSAVAEFLASRTATVQNDKPKAERKLTDKEQAMLDVVLKLIPENQHEQVRIEYLANTARQAKVRSPVSNSNGKNSRPYISEVRMLALAILAKKGIEKRDRETLNQYAYDNYGSLSLNGGYSAEDLIKALHNVAYKEAQLLVVGKSNLGYDFAGNGMDWEVV